MKRLSIIITCLLFLSILFSACNKSGICKKGSGEVEQREIYLDEIHSIDVEGDATLYITQGEEQKIEVETYKNLFSIVNQSVKNGKWKAKFDRCVLGRSRLTFYVTLKSIHDLEMSGSGKIIGTNMINTTRLNLSVEGSGEMKIQAEAENLESEVEGSGSLTISGKTGHHKTEIEGSGKIEAYDLHTGSSDVDISGSGKALINVEDYLSVKINGSGYVIYKGSPKVSSKINGSGKLSAY